MEQPEQVVLDWERALALVDGNRDLLVELIEIFEVEAPKLMAIIDASIQSGEMKELQRVAHMLKGNLRFFGDTAAKETAFRLEVKGRSADLADAAELAGTLRREMAPVMCELRRYAEQHPRRRDAAP